MPRYEYKVVPAPTKGLKAKGIRTPEARFAHAVQELMNGLSGYGWEYQRAETLPSVERSGLTGSTTEWRNVLVFRRLRENDADAFQPELLPAPEAAIGDQPEVAVPEEVAGARDAAPLTTEQEAAKMPDGSDPAAAEQPQVETPEQTPDSAENHRKSDA